MKAAVLNGVGNDFEIQDVELSEPKAGEVKVRLAASGVCHSDLSVQNGTLPLPMPVVCGHEGAGIVEEVGPDVSTLEPGDHVVLSWVPQCGRCFTCRSGQPHLCEDTFMVSATGGQLDGTTRFTNEAGSVHQMQALGTFSEFTVCPEISCVKIPDDMPLDKAALIGCGVLTGVGAALNETEIRPGSTVAVVGCGGVGLNVIQGAKIEGATRIIAIDVVPSKLELAKQFGATDVINSSETDPVAAVQGLTGIGMMGVGRGVDCAFEVVGASATLRTAIDVTRRGGTAIQVGVPRMDDMMPMSPFMDLFVHVKTIKGSFYGASDVFENIPKYVEMYQAGQLMLDELVSATIALDDVNGAIDAMEKGEVARSVIVY